MDANIGVDGPEQESSVNAADIRLIVEDFFETLSHKHSTLTWKRLVTDRSPEPLLNDSCRHKAPEAGVRKIVQSEATAIGRIAHLAKATVICSAFAWETAVWLQCSLTHPLET